MTKAGGPCAKPELRFPEFRNSKPWQKTVLRSVLLAHRLKSDGISRVHSVSVRRGLVNQLEHLGRSFAAANTSNYNLVKPFDVVYTKSPTGQFPFGIVKQSRIARDAIVSPLYGVFSPANKHVGRLIEAFFEDPARAVSYLEPIATKGAKNTIQISNDTFLSGAIYLPVAEEEQRKVAECLSALDTLIAAQIKKVEGLEAHKRGLVPRLFPRQGETLPRARFPGFARKHSWHTRKIASLLQKVSNPVAVVPDLSYREIGIRSHGKGIFHKKAVTGEAIGAKRVFHVVKNALVVNIVFAWEQAVATTCDAEEGMIASHRFPMFVARPGKCDVRYVKEFLLTRLGKHLLDVASPGGAGRNKTLGRKEFENLAIPLPESVEEQSRIADFLALIDDRIGAESKKLAALMAHKKGLLQRLFPSPAGD